MPPTKARDIFLIFHKMIDRAPDMEASIQRSDEYIKAKPEARVKMMEEKGDLNMQYAGLDPKKNVIVIRSGVTIKASVGNSPGLSVFLPGRENDTIEKKSSIYFPYEWGGENIALIPDQIAAFMDIPMKIEDASTAASQIQNNSATMVIEMLPLSAQGNSPMSLDGLSQWLLMTKIVAVTYYNQYTQPIWSWKSRDYQRIGGSGSDSSQIEQLKK